ncbi:MAG: FadR/GntR family transcriptional regulator [Clostridia bacterium]
MLYIKIIKVNITQQVIEYIKENIENGTWPVGEKIPSENDLTKMLQVSRSSVRVALQQFIAIGALTSIHGKGTFVKNNDLRAFIGNQNNVIHDMDSDIDKVLEFRKIIESESCYLAAQNATEKNIENLTYYLNQMMMNIGNSEMSVKNDMDFHLEIARSTGNRYIEISLSEIFRQKINDHKILNEVYGYKDGIYYHSVILKAIKERKPKSAKSLMKEHIQQSLERPIILEKVIRK